MMPHLPMIFGLGRAIPVVPALLRHQRAGLLFHAGRLAEYHRPRVPLAASQLYLL